MYQLLQINFNQYELPKFKESRKGNWYEYGTDRPYKNTYPDYLTYLYDKSSKHAQIINSKVKYIVGQGFAVDNDIELQQRAAIEGFLRHPNDTDTMNELLGKLAKDKKVYGGFAMQVRLNNLGAIASMDHIDFSDVRVGVDEDVYYYTDDWKARSPESNEDFTEFKAFTFEEKLSANENYLIYYKEYRPDLGVYPLPDYVSAINYLESDISISTFTLNNIKNNLSSGYLISFRNGECPPEQMADIERRFKDYATGEGRAGSPLLSFNDADAPGPEILPIPTNGQDDRFIQLNTQIREEIFTAHGITSPKLMGLNDSGSSLGNNADEIAVASQLYQNLQIDPEQTVFDQLFNMILNYNGLPKAIHLLKIEPVERGLTEAAILGVMTPEEVREKIGLPPSDIEINKVAEAIGLLNPLVATKILDTMNAEEIRGLIGLGGGVVKTTETLKREFNDLEDEMLFLQLNETGFDLNDYEVIDSFQNEITSLETAKKYEGDILTDYSFTLDRVLNDTEKSILGMLKGNPKLPVTEIVKALELPIEDVNNAIANLQDAGALDKNFVPTQEGKESIQEPAEKLFIVYKYIKRPNAPALKTRSRAFCIKMMSLAAQGRVYTLSQLEMLVNGFGQSGIDIFTKRGGFYTLPDVTPKRTLPYCRHIWEQKLVRAKKK